MDKKSNVPNRGGQNLPGTQKGSNPTLPTYQAPPPPPPVKDKS